MTEADGVSTNGLRQSTQAPHASDGSSAKVSTLVYADMQADDVTAVVKFMAEHFYPREPLSTGLHMTYEDNKEWIYDSVKSWLRSGASVVARDADTGTIAGTILANVLTKTNNTSFDDALNSPRTKVKTLHTVLSVLEASVDFFERFSAHKILELTMITVAEQYGGRGVGRRLVQESERRGQDLGCQVSTAQATAVASQRLLERLGYHSVHEMDYGSFSIAGHHVFDVDNMMGSSSAKVMARMLTPVVPAVTAVSDKWKGEVIPHHGHKEVIRLDRIVRRRVWKNRGLDDCHNTTSDENETRDDGQKTTDDEYKVADDEQNTTNGEHSTKDEAHENIGEGQNTNNDGHSTTDDEHTTTDDGHNITDNGQKISNDGCKTADDGPGTTNNEFKTMDEQYNTTENADMTTNDGCYSNDIEHLSLNDSPNDKEFRRFSPTKGRRGPL